MVRVAWLVIFAAIVTSGVIPGHAAEPYRDFVRGLRSQGMTDIALDYLTELARNPSPRHDPLIELEIAKARADFAGSEPDERRKLAAFAAAEAAFRDLLTRLDDPVLASETQLELARLIAQHGKYHASLARRQPTTAARRKSITAARSLFGKAAELFATVSDATKKPGLSSEMRLRAELDRAILRTEEALTLTDQRDFKARADEIRAAQRLFHTVAEENPDSPIGWLALVWNGRCFLEIDNKAEARKVFEGVARSRTKAPGDAARLAGYYLLELIDQDTQGRNRLTDLHHGCEEWLVRHGAAWHTPEGQGVRFLLASGLEEQARPGIQMLPDGDAKVSTTSRALLTRAEKTLKELVATENDYSSRARRKRLTILVVLMAGKEELLERQESFEECYLTAQVRAHELTQVKTDARGYKELSRHLDRTILALQKATRLATPADSPDNVFDAHAMLAYAYLLADDPFAAAVQGEHAARSAPTHPRAAEAAGYALQAYARILAESREGHSGPYELKTDQRRLRTLAGFMETTWPDESATDGARHQLGLLLFDDQDYAEACALLGRIDQTYPNLALARYHLGIAALQLLLNDAKSTTDVKYRLVAEAIAKIESTPAPAPSGDLDSALAWLQAQLQRGALLLTNRPDAKAFEVAQELGQALGRQTTTLLPADDPRVPQLRAEADKLRLTGLQGRAHLLMKADRAGDAKRILGPMIEQAGKELSAAKSSSHREQPWFQSYLQVLREVLVLDFRLSVRAGRPDEAIRALDLVHQSTGQTGRDTADRLVLAIVREMKDDLERLRKRTGADEVRRLNKSLVAFLDELARSGDLSTEYRASLADAYSAIERHDRAVSLLREIREPPAADETASRAFRAARLALAREHRLSAQFPQAKAVLSDIMLGWGKDELEVRREAVELMEAMDSLGGAVKACRETQAQLQASVRDLESKTESSRRLRTEIDRLENTAAPDDKLLARLKKEEDELGRELLRLVPLKDRFWEFYFLEIRSQIKADAKATDPKAKVDRMKRTAARLVRLEKTRPDFGGPGMRDNYRGLLDFDPVLKQEYRSEGGKLLIASAEPPVQ